MSAETKEVKEVKKPTVEDFRAFGQKVGETAKSATENKDATAELSTTVDSILTEILPSLMM